MYENVMTVAPKGLEFQLLVGAHMFMLLYSSC